MKLLRLILASFTVLASAASLHSADRSRYLDLMEIAVRACTPGHIEQYISDTDSLVILEHGYARLTSNPGILISHGRMQEMKSMFERMMDICTRELPEGENKAVESCNDGSEG